jgi:hypothetical protein
MQSLFRDWNFSQSTGGGCGKVSLSREKQSMLGKCVHCEANFELLPPQGFYLTRKAINDIVPFYNSCYESVFEIG